MYIDEMISRLMVFFLQTSMTEVVDRSGIVDLFSAPAIRRISLLLYIVWFSTYLVYYGLVLNLSNLGGNIYLNSIISGR